MAEGKAGRRVLILGGSAEAAELARLANAALSSRAEVISSLAGRLKPAQVLPGTMRIGGFGGASGLAEYLNKESIDLVIDATHPFAETISAHAHDACDRAGVPRLMLIRPPWRLPGGGKWIEVDDMAAAAQMLPRVGRRVFLTVGASGLEAFSHIEGVHFLVRLIEDPGTPLALADYELVTGRPPHSLESERALFEGHHIDTLVAKHSGGGATVGKIAAALEVEARIILIRRPLPEPGEVVETPAEALSWLEKRV